jgi:hypothetical protein
MWSSAGSTLYRRIRITEKKKRDLKATEEVHSSQRQQLRCLICAKIVDFLIPMRSW